MEKTHDVGITLSGGGHRATAFSLGALLAVIDAEVNRQTVSVASVSGGSIANAVAMIGPDYRSVETAAFESHISPTLRVVASRGLLLGAAPATKWYVRSLVGSGIAGAVGVVTALVVALFDRTKAALIALVLGGGFLGLAWTRLRQRSQRTENAIDAEVLGGKRMTLADIKRRKSSVHHVICTTELQSGEPLYFTNRGVWSYRFGGSTSDSQLPLATAVQASACVPGAFDPRVIPLATLGLGNLTVPVTKTDKRTGEKTTTDQVISEVVLDDGGVYDNMADEWEYGYPNRAKSWDALKTLQASRANYLIVVNGSGGWNTPKPIAKGAIQQELQGLLRAQGVQYDVSTTHRRRALYTMFRASEGRPEGGADGGVDGIFAQITDSPYRIPQMMSTANLATADADKQWPADIAARADEAAAFLDSQGYSPDQWKAIIGRTGSAATTLEKLGVPLTAELVEHGYVLTTLLMYVLDGIGELRPIDRQRFTRLCQ